MDIKARFYVESVTALGAPNNGGVKSAEVVKLRAVYASDADSPNYSYSVATPSASLEMMITNMAAWGAFKPGHSYDVLFTPTVEA